MARVLSVAQKKVLNRYPHVQHFDALPGDVQDHLYKLRDYESLHSDATRYLMDTYLKLIYN